MSQRKSIHKIFKLYTSYILALIVGVICTFIRVEDTMRTMVINIIGFTIAIISLLSLFKYGEIIGKTLEEVVDKCG